MVALNYINLFSIAIGKLKTEAYSKLINEIQEESNKLYSQYMGGNNQGKLLLKKTFKLLIKKRTKEFLILVEPKV